MTQEEFAKLYLMTIQKLRETEWHWFSYHFYNGPTSFARSILACAASINTKTEGIGTELLLELISIGGNERDERQYEQLIQKLSELLVIERIVQFDWPQGTTFQHEPEAYQGGPRPELRVNFHDRELIIEVKTPSLLEHIRNRNSRPVQLPYRGGVPRKLAENLTDDGGVVLPRDNPVKDFLIDANRKFEGFRNGDEVSTLLVIVWDDFIFEPISTLINDQSGLLTDSSYVRTDEGEARRYPNIDQIVIVRHLNYFVQHSREEPLIDREHAMDFGDQRALPNVCFDAHGDKNVPEQLLEHLRAIRHDDPAIANFADYRAQDIVFWI